MDKHEHSSAPRPMKGPGGPGGGERAKDFKTALGKLLTFAKGQR